MSLLTPLEYQLKTSLPVDEVLDRFSKRCNINGNSFTRNSDPLSVIPRSYVVGTVYDGDIFTIIDFKVKPAPFTRVFIWFWMSFTTIALIYLGVKSLIHWQYDNKLHFMAVFWVAGFVIAQFSFSSSGYDQKRSLKLLLR